MRMGIIASDPRYNYEDLEGDSLIYEILGTPGSSGSPVFAIEKEKVIGINAGYLVDISNDSHSGISYFYKSSAILELIDSN